GKLFQSKWVTRNNSELMVIITPELVRPIAAQQPVPELKITKPFMEDNTEGFKGHPGMDKTGPVPVHPPIPSLPVEELFQTMPTPGGNGGIDNSGTPATPPPAGGRGGGGGNGE